MKSDQIKIELQCEVQRALTPTKGVSPFCYTYLRGRRKIQHTKKCNQYETKIYTESEIFHIFFFACVILIIALVTR